MTRRAPAIALAASLCLAGCAEARLELDPAVLPDCTPARGAVIHVAWDARDAGTDRVRLEVTRPGGGSRPWTQGPAAGSKDTGPWGSDGLTFVLLSAEGDELARRTVETFPCKTPQGAKAPSRR